MTIFLLLEKYTTYRKTNSFFEEDEENKDEYLLDEVEIDEVIEGDNGSDEEELVVVSTPSKENQAKV